uniref:uncharacterized protein LOC114677739 n=1 Tax=Macaca mulatta TaxID=9544 RepID=UPI0010A246C1|nr:uncharacterized protein LOC114677739 [Macaca mulatta]
MVGPGTQPPSTFPAPKWHRRHQFLELLILSSKGKKGQTPRTRAGSAQRRAARGFSQPGRSGGCAPHLALWQLLARSAPRGDSSAQTSGCWKGLVFASVSHCSPPSGNPVASTLPSSAGCPGLLFTFLFNLTLLARGSLCAHFFPTLPDSSLRARWQPKDSPAAPRRWRRCGVQCPFLPDPRLNPPSSDPLRSPEPGDLASSVGGHSVTRAAALWPEGGRDLGTASVQPA